MAIVQWLVIVLWDLDFSGTELLGGEVQTSMSYESTCYVLFYATRANSLDWTRARSLLEKIIAKGLQQLSLVRTLQSSLFVLTFSISRIQLCAAAIAWNLLAAGWWLAVTFCAWRGWCADWQRYWLYTDSPEVQSAWYVFSESEFFDKWLLEELSASFHVWTCTARGLRLMADALTRWTVAVLTSDWKIALI